VSGLLGQSHGFEGFRVIDVVLDLDDPAISEGVDGSQVRAQVDPAAPTPASPVETSHDPVAHGEDFFDSQTSASLPGFIDICEEAPELLATAKRLCIGKTGLRAYASRPPPL
jgi:hypothetical protein